MENTENPFFYFPKTMVVEGNLSFDYRCSRPQKQRGKPPPSIEDFFDEHFGVKTALKVRKGNAFHSSGQISNNLVWEKNELKVSKRNAAVLSVYFFSNHSSNWRRKGGGGYGGGVLSDVVRFPPRNGKTVVIASS